MGNSRSRARFQGGYNSDDSDRLCDCSAWDDYGDCTCKERRRSPPRKKPEVEMKYLKSEEEEEGADNECCRITYWAYRDHGSSLEVKYCDWTITEFEESNVHKEIGCERSEVFTAGNYNQFQFYFTLDRYETAENETYFGVYVNILSEIRSEAVVNFKSFLINSRAEKLALCPPRKQKFPRKAGFRFLGSICKSAIIIHDEDCYSDRYVPDNNLCLRFKINLQYKIPKSFESLKELLKKNKKKDITLVVKGQEFPANRKILATRSPVLSKLLDGNPKAKKITIDDIEPEVMHQLLLYIYTNRVTKMFTYVDKLSAAATKYKLTELKALCKKVQPLKGLNPAK